jgi:hypothetical protein
VTLSMNRLATLDWRGPSCMLYITLRYHYVQLLTANVEDEETVCKIMTSLKDVYQHATPGAAAFMAKSNNMGSIIGVLKLFADSPAIVSDAISIMASTARVTGAESAGIDREGMLAAASAQAQFAAVPAVQSAVAALQGVMSLKFTEVEASIRVMSSSLQAAVAAVQSVGTVQVQLASSAALLVVNRHLS